MDAYTFSVIKIKIHYRLNAIFIYCFLCLNEHQSQYPYVHTLSISQETLKVNF